MKTNADYAREWRLKNAAKVRAYRIQNRERRIQQAREWQERNSERFQQSKKKWTTENREYVRKYKRNWDKTNPRKREDAYKRNHTPKQKARMALRVKLRAGKIIRPSSCSNCGKACKPHGHHPDYSKPLDVIWLCPPCHSAIHRKVS